MHQQGSTLSLVTGVDLQHHSALRTQTVWSCSWFGGAYLLLEAVCGHWYSLSLSRRGLCWDVCLRFCFDGHLGGRLPILQQIKAVDTMPGL